MEAIWISTGAVALAEIGDKTQLLAIVLAARFGKPWPILAGILCATLLNHAAAAAAGYFIAQWLSGQTFQLIVGAEESWRIEQLLEGIERLEKGRRRTPRGRLHTARDV